MSVNLISCVGLNAEFEGYLQNDDARLAQLQCNTAFEKHPFNCFSWGIYASLHGFTNMHD